MLNLTMNKENYIEPIDETIELKIWENINLIAKDRVPRVYERETKTFITKPIDFIIYRTKELKWYRWWVYNESTSLFEEIKSEPDYFVIKGKGVIFVTQKEKQRYNLNIANGIRSGLYIEVTDVGVKFLGLGI